MTVNIFSSAQALPFLTSLAYQIKYVWSKFWFQNKKGSSKISYELRAYESVEDMSLSKVISQKSTENKI